MARWMPLVIVAAVLTASAQERPVDLLLSGGRIITVDARFSIAQAVAIRDGRIAAVGTNAEMARLAGPSTRRIDLAGKAVIPGLIDNHMHLLRAGATWQREVRLDGVGSRKQAFDMLTARVKATPPGEWIYTLGGWTPDQFADDPGPLTRDELDRIAPQHPVFLQSSYHRGFANRRAIEALGITNPSGVVEESELRGVAARLPVARGEALETSTRAMLRDLNKAGLTAFGSAGCEPEALPLYRRWTQRREMPARVFCITSELRQRTGDPFLDHVAYGEVVYAPLHDPMFVRTTSPQPNQLLEWRRIASEVARIRMPLHVHANLTNTIGAFLDQIALINADHPIAGLRWTLAHVNQIGASHLATMKTLGMAAAVHPWAVINGGINRGVFGDAASDMPPLRTIQDSGIPWGFGSDGSRANQVLPFVTLWFAVTGKMVGGTTVLRQTITREEALVAHTRGNAYLLFQEKNIGSIEVGKAADLAVLDRDYLTVPADEIKDITSIMTIVNGRIVYER